MSSFKHPGGDSLITDDYNVFKSVHPHPRYEKRLKLIAFKFKKGGMYTYTSDFAQNILKLNFDGSHIAPIEWWVRFGVLNATLIYTEIAYIQQPTLVTSIALGVVYALLGLCIGHDGSHGAVGNKYTNEFCSYYMDFIGNTNYAWHHQHILQHHPYTNESDLDPDATSAEPFLVFDKERGHFSPINTLFTLILGPSIVYDISKLIPKFKIETRRVIVSIVLRLYLFWKIFFVGYPFFGQIVVLTSGCILALLFQVSHNTQETKRNMLKDGSVDWYKNQVLSSSTYGGYTAGLVTGGLNYQIEHHIFPHMNSCYYPRISDTVRKICDSHGVRYTYYKSYSKNLMSFLKQ